MQKLKQKIFVLLIGLLLSTTWCKADASIFMDGHHPIQVKEAHVQDAPRGSTIQAFIDGHTLTVFFTENLGQVNVEVATASGTLVQYTLVPTPNGLQIYIPYAGDYIVTFTLSNGDEYYGEFTVTD